jgi:hypothetical protein
VSAVKPFGEMAPLLIKIGYQPVPLYPGTKRPAVTGWPDYAFSPSDDFSRPFRFGGVRYPRYETGIICGETIGLDIDVRDARMVRKLLALADSVLGSAPTRTGQPPKALGVYAAAQSFPKFRSRSFSLPGDDVDDPDYRPHMIEVLGRGTQFVCTAIHNKTGKPYKWSNSDGLLSVPQSSLTINTEDQFRKYIAAAEALLLANKAKVFGTNKVIPATGLPAITAAKFPQSLRRQLSRDASAQCAGVAGLVKHDAAACRAALAAIPNDDKDYELWWRVGQACAAALGESGRKDFSAWSRKSKKHDQEGKGYTDRAYTGFLKYAAQGKSQITGGSIFHMAKQAGWKSKPQRPHYWKRPAIRAAAERV